MATDPKRDAAARYMEILRRQPRHRGGIQPTASNAELRNRASQRPGISGEAMASLAQEVPQLEEVREAEYTPQVETVVGEPYQPDLVGKALRSGSATGAADSAMVPGLSPLAKILDMAEPPASFRGYRHPTEAAEAEPPLGLSPEELEALMAEHAGLTEE